MKSLEQISLILKSLWKPVLAGSIVIILLFWIWGLIWNGTLEITVAQSPTTLYIDDQGFQIGNTSSQSISPGTHTIKIRKDGYVDYSQQLQIGSREKKTLNVTLVKQPKHLVTSSKLSSGFGNLVKFPALTPDESRVYYLSDGGSTLYQMNLDGSSKQAISSNIFTNPQIIEWSPDLTKIIIQTVNYKFQLGTVKSPFYSASDPDLSTVSWIYEIPTRKLTKLGTNIINPVWSADGKLIYYSSSASSPGVFQVLSDGSGPRQLFGTEFDQVTIQPSPDGKYLAWFPDPEGIGVNNKIHLVKLSDLTSIVLTPNGYSNGAKWSSDSHMILFDHYSSDKLSPILAVVDINSLKIVQLADYLTVGKSFWDTTGKQVYSFDANSASIVLTNIATDQSSPLYNTGKDAVEFILPISGGNRLLYTSSDSLYLLDWR